MFGVDASVLHVDDPSDRDRSSQRGYRAATPRSGRTASSAKTSPIGARTVLQAHVVVNGWTEIGEDCQIYPFATIGAASQDRKYSGERAFTQDRQTARCCAST